MFYGNSTTETRQLFYTAWTKYNQKKPLLPLEQQLIDIMLAHPEYHAILEESTKHLHHTYFPELGETNPFLHMGLHLAVREQIATDRPYGIRNIYQQLTQNNTSSLEAEHAIMECLAEALWHAQRHQTMPDEMRYLEACQQLLS
jgi:hypothetical protein